MKVRTTDSRNQELNVALAMGMVFLLHSFIRSTLRAIVFAAATTFSAFFLVCFWFGAKEFFHRLPTSIEIIKSFFI